MLYDGFSYYSIRVSVAPASCPVDQLVVSYSILGNSGDVCVWVVNQELDLNNPKTFRNLAKPMGAQTDDRLTQYKKRYKDWEDPNGKICSILSPFYRMESRR